jgi:hypothetical protein
MGPSSSVLAIARVLGAMAASVQVVKANKCPPTHEHSDRCARSDGSEVTPARILCAGYLVAQNCLVSDCNHTRCATCSALAGFQLQGIPDLDVQVCMRRCHVCQPIESKQALVLSANLMAHFAAGGVHC